MQDNTGPAEIEIKLRLTKDAREALEHHPAFASPNASSPKELRQVTTYFDTAELALHSESLSLRIRRSGQQRVLTVKTTGDPNVVAARRGEWERSVEGDTPDLSYLRTTPVGHVMQAVHETSLHPIFKTDIRRVGRLLNCGCNTTVEAVFDEGSIISEGRSEPISEMELELKAGSVSSLYRLALEFATTVPLSLETETKAERGFRLRFGEQPRVAKAQSVPIAEGASSAEALRIIISSCLGHMLANVAGAEHGDAEGIHQVRIAIRRLRAALILFKPLLHSNVFDRFNGELRGFGTVFGKARDWDVFVLQTLPAVATDRTEIGCIDPLRQAAQSMRAGGHHDVTEGVCDPAFTRLVLGLASWVEDGVRAPELIGAEMANPLAETAPALLDRMLRKVVSLGQHLKHASPEHLHALRKAMKKLRYSLEFLSCLYPHKHVKAYLEPCKELQDLLGLINDAAVTPILLDGLLAMSENVSPKTVRILTERTTKSGERALHRVARLWDAFHAAESFWR